MPPILPPRESQRLKDERKESSARIGDCDAIRDAYLDARAAPLQWPAWRSQRVWPLKPHSPSDVMLVKTRRRWFRYSLRTFFVLIAVAGCAMAWLKWNLGQVRQREALLQKLRHPLNTQAFFVEDIGWDGPPPSPKVPVTWSLLGARPVAIIHLQRYRLSVEEERQIREWFPEATIMNVGADRPATH